MFSLFYRYFTIWINNTKIPYNIHPPTTSTKQTSSKNKVLYKHYKVDKTAQALLTTVGRLQDSESTRLPQQHFNCFGHNKPLNFVLKRQ